MKTERPFVVGDSEEDTALLEEMALKAELYIRSFAWCPPIIAFDLAFGVGKVFALFLAQFETPVDGLDRRLWIVVGDLPSAYFVFEDDEAIAETIERYCLLMDDWCEAVISEAKLSEVFPVMAEPTNSNAKGLQRRILRLRRLIIPQAARFDA